MARTAPGTANVAADRTRGKADIVALPAATRRLAGLLLIVGSTTVSAEQVTCVSEVTSISDFSRMSTGDFSAKGIWADVALAATSIGYGPAANREYELTVLDGKIYLAKPDDAQVIVRHNPRPNEGFAMLQLASPKAWIEQAELARISSFDDLNFELDQVVDDLGCDDRVLLPYLVKGYASSMTWSMDTAPVDQVTTTADQAVMLVGLYNRLQKQKYFMVRGYNLHAHVVFPALDQAGHMRDLQLDGGARPYLPAE